MNSYTTFLEIPVFTRSIVACKDSLVREYHCGRVYFYKNMPEAWRDSRNYRLTIRLLWTYSAICACANNYIYNVYKLSKYFDLKASPEFRLFGKFYFHINLLERRHSVAGGRVIKSNTHSSGFTIIYMYE